MAVQKPSDGAAAGVVDSDLDRWRSAVAGVLAKTAKKDPAELGTEPERLLDSPTYDTALHGTVPTIDAVATHDVTGRPRP